MAAVAGVDHRDGGVEGGYQGGAFLGVAHGTDVRIAGDHADSVGYAFALGGRAGGGRRKAKNTAAEIQHGSFKTQAGSGAWLIKKGRYLFTVTNMGISGEVMLNIRSQIKELVDLFYGKV